MIFCVIEFGEMKAGTLVSFTSSVCSSTLIIFQQTLHRFRHK